MRHTLHIPHILANLQTFLIALGCILPATHHKNMHHPDCGGHRSNGKHLSSNQAACGPVPMQEYSNQTPHGRARESPSATKHAPDRSCSRYSRLPPALAAPIPDMYQTRLDCNTAASQPDNNGQVHPAIPTNQRHTHAQASQCHIIVCQLLLQVGNMAVQANDGRGKLPVGNRKMFLLGVPAFLFFIQLVDQV